MEPIPASEEAFRGRYWLKDELIRHAKYLGLSSQGSKEDLFLAIIAKVYGHTAPSLVKENKESRTRAQKNKVLSLDTPIASPYVNDEEHRNFFLGHIPHFKFNVQFMNWMKAQQGVKTYQEAITQWHRIADEKKSGKKLAIGKQFEYNQYTRDFFTYNPTKTREDCIRCWNFRKSQQGLHRYHESDLDILKP